MCKLTKGTTKVKNFLLFFLAFCLSLQSFAMTIDSCFSAQLDLANRWVWRGVSYSEAPVIQPSISYTTEKLNLIIWGSYPFERRAYSEIDFTAEYQFSSVLKLGFTNYFGINDSIGAHHNFFNFNRKSTNHLMDIYTYISPFRKIPLTFQYSLWFWGADRDVVSEKQNYSSYIEAKYEKKLANNVNVGLFIGGTTSKGFYASRAAIVNIGAGVSKPIKIGNLMSIPLKVEFILNPELKNVYINAIITLK